MEENLVVFLIATLVITSISVISILKMVFKHRRGPHREMIAGLEERLVRIERRLDNLETIATSKDEALRESFEALAREN